MDMTSPTPLIVVKGLKKTFTLEETEVRALDGVDFSIATGEFVAIMGASGSGKSTLMHLLGCLDTPSEGMYDFGGQPVSALSPDERAALRNDRIGFVFQDFNLLPRISAHENVETPLLFTRAVPAAERQKRVTSALTRVGLAGRQHHLPTQLSGGEKQRVAIARALVNQPDLILADEPTGNLDSKNGAETMKILRSLHAHGITIVLITHDPGVAAHASRRILLSDGRIVADELQTPPADITVAAATNTSSPGQSVSSAESCECGDPNVGLPGWQMPATPVAEQPAGLFSRVLDLPWLFSGVTQGWRSLEKNPFRSLLTTLGILIGIWAVISIGAIGKSFYVGFRDKVLLLNSDMVMVSPYGFHRTAKRSNYTKGVLTETDVAALEQNLKEAAIVSPLIFSGGKATFEKREMDWLHFAGVSDNYLHILKRTLKAGRFFSSDEVKKAARVCVITDTIAQELYPDRKALGQEIFLKGFPFIVVGVIKREQYEFFSGGDVERTIHLPFTTIKRDIEPTTNPEDIERIQILVTSPDDISRVDFQTRKILRWCHNIRGNREEDFNVRNTEEISLIIGGMTSMVVLLILCIAGISLVVGGIGVMNIMLVSVAERTREIGVLMAVGARRADVLLQILIESLTVSGIGGAIGVFTGLITALVVQFSLESVLMGFCNIGLPETIEILGRFLAFPLLSAALILFALGISGMTGLLFGAYPAWKASNLDPIKALRTL